MEETDAMTGEEGEASFPEKIRSQVTRKWQQFLDQSTVHLWPRWGAFFVVMALYFLRVYYLNGWYIVSYGLGIYLLNLFIGFLSPQMDPETDGPLLPTKNSETEEFRPFSRRVPEFKFWYASTKATVIAFFMTFFNFFNIPVFWPILLLYFIALFFLTMKRQIKHMWKHNYVPWSSGKTKFCEGGAPPKESK